MYATATRLTIFKAKYHAKMNTLKLITNSVWIIKQKMCLDGYHPKTIIADIICRKDQNRTVN